MNNLIDLAGPLVWEIDAQGTHFSVRGAFTDIIHIARDEWFERIHPEDRSRVREAVESSFAAKRYYSIEYRLATANESRRWVLETGASRWSAHGNYLGFGGTVVDITEKQQLIERLAEQEATYRLKLESVPDLISVHQFGGNYVYTSAAFVRILGYQGDELVDTNAYDLVHPEDVERVRGSLQAQLQHEAPGAAIDFRFRHKLGHYLWLEAKANVVASTTTGGPQSVVLVSRDVTAERTAELDASEREAHYRSVHHSNNWYWETDQLGRFTVLPSKSTATGGIRVHHALGKTRQEIAMDPWQPGLLEYLRKVECREPFSDLIYQCRTQKPGETAYVAISGEPMYVAGVFKGYQGVGRDVTRRIQLEQQLEQVTAEKRVLIDSAMDIVVSIDDDGLLAYANPVIARILGHAPETVVGKPFASLLVPGAEGTAASMFAESRRKSETLHTIETQCRHHDGTVIYINWSIHYSSGEHLLHAVGRDVTERHNAQVVLDDFNRRFLSMLERMGDGFFSVDRNWRITYVNEKTAQFVGRTKEMLIGRLVEEAAPEVITSSVFPYHQRAMATGEQVFFTTFYEPAKAWVEVRSYPHEGGLSVFFTDITEKHAAYDALVQSEQRLRDVIELTPVGYVVLGPGDEIREVNPAVCALTGYSREELLRMTTAQLFAFCPWSDALNDKSAGDQFYGREGVIRDKEGNTLHVIVNATIKRRQEGLVDSITLFTTDISEHKKHQANLEHMANHDALTGLPNRTQLERRLRKMVEAGTEQEQCAILFLDLDGFKEINDALGHKVGDLLLQAVSKRLSQSMRPSDTVARHGGDEFVVAVSCPKGKESAATVARKLNSVFEEPFVVQGKELFVQASIGISMYPAHGASLDELLKCADTAMYQAKAAGRNCYRCYTEKMGHEATMKIALENGLRRALERGQFELHYQPRLVTRSGDIKGVEALIRWRHPELGMISPAQFIPVAEQRGLIDAIGAWVLEKACTDMLELVEKTGRHLDVSVNVSARQLRSPEFVDQVRATLNRTNFPHYLLELELTETAFVEDAWSSAALLKSLKQLGVKLALDDFGTGYSSLSYLKRFPIDVLKLDKSFLAEESDAIDHVHFLKATIDLAHALTLTVVAEGVEEERTFATLRKLGCDEVQGYLFAKPMPFEALVTWLRQPRAA